MLRGVMRLSCLYLPSLRLFRTELPLQNANRVFACAVRLPNLSKRRRENSSLSHHAEVVMLFGISQVDGPSAPP